MFYPNTAKASAKTGKVPVYVRVTLNRTKAEARLNIEIPRTDVIKWNGRTMRFDDREMTANVLLNTIDKKFNDFCYHNGTKLVEYSATSIRNIILGLDAKPNPKIMDFINKYYINSIAANPHLAEGTKRNYRKALKHLRIFLLEQKKKDALLRDINMKMANEFKDYLLQSNPKTGKIGMKEPSALDNVKRLRTIFNRAVEEEQMPANPFNKIKLKNKSAIRGRLDINQIKDINDLNLCEFRTQQLYKDLFLFSVFTGLAYADASALKQSDLNIMRDGNIRLFIKRAKTEIITEMVLPKQAVAIISKYRQTPEIQITGAVLPKRSNKEVNVQLKVLANMVNIPIKLSTHIARHTFRQLLAEADIFEMGVIKRMMGHTSRNEIDGTYFQVTESRLLEAKRKFELYLDKSFYESDTK